MSALPYKIARPPGTTLYCDSGRIRMATVPSGCPKVVEVAIANAGALPGDFIHLEMSLPGSCNSLQSCGNEINNNGMAGCQPVVGFKSSIADPPVWDAECFAQHFHSILLSEPRLLGLLEISFDNATQTIRFEGKHPSVCFDIADKSQGFALTITEVVPGEPSADIPYGAAVCVDHCGFAHLVGSNPDCAGFTGFVVQCGDRFVPCGEQMVSAESYHSGLSIPVLEANSSIVVIPASMPLNLSDVPAFDPAAPFGTVSFVPHGSAPPTGGFVYAGWTIESFSLYPSEIVLSHSN